MLFLQVVRTTEGPQTKKKSGGGGGVTFSVTTRLSLFFQQPKKN